MRLPLLLDLPGRDEAREAAQRELSHHAYQEAQPPWFERLLRWLLGKLDDLVSSASSNLPFGGWGLLFLVALALGLVAVVVMRLRPTARGAQLPTLFGGGQARTAAQHRALADAAAGRGEYAEAVRERLRAVVRELESRGAVDPRPGRTADEVAREAGLAVPVLAVPLAQGAQLFDEVWYGGRTADASSYAALVALDERVVATRLVTA